MRKSRKSMVYLVCAAFVGLAFSRPAAAEEVWVPPTHFVPPGLDVFPWPTSGSGLASFGFAVPDDFAAFTSAKVVLIPRAGLSGSFDVYGNIKREGEAAGAGLLFNLAIPATVTAGVVQEIDITALFGAELDSSSAGSDYVSVFFWFPASPGLEDATVLGMRFVYDAARVTTADLENGAVTNAKLADNSIGPDKIADNSLTGADIENNSLTGADILNGTVGAADINTNQVQARASGACPAGESVSAILATGALICESDGMTSHLRVSEERTCAANDECNFIILCPGSRKVMGGGANVILSRYSDVHMAASYPFSVNSWSVGVMNNYSLEIDVEVFAVCSAEAT